MPETINAKAEVIDDSLAALSEPEKWISSANARVKKVVKDYMPHPITNFEDYRQSKRERTAARKEIKAIEDDAASKLKAIKDAVRTFETAKREALMPLKSIDEGYREAIFIFERTATESKLEDVEAAYLDYAPGLAELVPFSKLREKYAEAEKWENLTTNSEAIKQALYKHIDQIAADEKTIDAQPVDDAEKKAMKADFFSCLDLGEVLRKSSERLRVAELERKRAEALKQEQDLLERQRAEEQAALQQTAAQAAQPVAQPAPQDVTEAVPQPAPQAAPVGTTPPINTAPAAVAQLSSHPWVVIIEDATGEQMKQVARALGSVGVAGIIKPGTLEEVFYANH